MTLGPFFFLCFNILINKVKIKNRILGIYLLICVQLLAEYRSMIDIDIIVESLANSHHTRHPTNSNFVFLIFKYV